MIGFGVSDNGKWLVGASSNSLIRYNLDSEHAERVGIKNFFSNDMWPNPTVEGFASDDGNTVGVVGQMTGFIVVEIDKRCIADEARETVDYSIRMPDIFRSDCPAANLSDKLYPYSAPNMYHGEVMKYSNPTITRTGGIRYYDQHTWHQISYAPQPILQYLALGDSFASGEGDNNPQNYLAGTNVFGDYPNGVPRENCHISNSSYPILLGAGMSMVANQDMRSIACSGALTSDIVSPAYDTRNPSLNLVDSNYMGQSTQAFNGMGTSIPRLQGIATSQSLQDDARQSYIPGRVQQIELIKKAQPAVATVMIGGNDFGFGESLTRCVLNLSLTKFDQSCDIATPEGRKQKAQEILTGYSRLKSTYTALHQVSPTTKLFVVGYPKFLVDQTTICPEMVFSNLTQVERVSINQLIDYANAMIRNAALDSGATYIDMTNALGNTAACGNSMSVTGVDNLINIMIQTNIMKSKNYENANIQKYGSAGEWSNIIYRQFFATYVDQMEALKATASVLYSPNAAMFGAMQSLMHPNEYGHQLIYSLMKDSLGPDLLYSDHCNQIIICRDGSTSHGPADVAQYIPGLALQNDTVVRSGDGVVSIGYTLDEAATQAGVAHKGKKGISIEISRPRFASLMQANSIFAPKASLHSTPINLGTAILGNDGVYHLTADVPSTTPVGWHDVHVTGQLDTDDYYDIYVPVFVAGPIGDYDDDGVADAEDTCAFATPSGKDADGDGVDDACQLTIEQDRVPLSTSSYVDTIPLASKSGNIPEVRHAAVSNTAPLGGSISSGGYRLDVQSNDRALNISQETPQHAKPSVSEPQFIIFLLLGFLCIFWAILVLCWRRYRT